MRAIMNAKQSSSDEAKSEYAVEVQKTQTVQTKHFEENMPDIFKVSSNQST